MEGQESLTGGLSVYTIYKHPKDFEEYWVIRHLVGSTSKGAWLAKSLEEARTVIPAGCVCLARSPDDDPSIFESWI